MLNFVTNSLSSLYFTAIKDRLYCDHQDSKKRISAQYTLFVILNTVTRAVAPMVPHLAEEIYSYLPHKAADSFFKDRQVYIKQEWRNENLNKLLDVILDVKSEINKEFGSETLGIGVNVRLPLILFRNLSVSKYVFCCGTLVLNLQFFSTNLGLQSLVFLAGKNVFFTLNFLYK